MKMGIVACVVLTLLIILLTLFNFYLHKTVASTINEIEQAQTHIKNADYDNAAKNHKTAQNEWEKKERIYELLIEQSELDQINSLFSEADVLINEKRYTEYLLTSHKLCSFLNHISAENKVNLETIL